MKIRLIVLGKTTSEAIKQLETDYTKRIQRYGSFDISIIDNSSIKGDTEAIIKQKEGELLIKKFQPADHVILLDEKGKSMHSVAFAGEISNWMMSAKKTVIFVIGGAYGFSPEVKNRANGSISLSAMTFSHQIVRALFLEQLYRAFTILNNEPYHHA